MELNCSRLVAKGICPTCFTEGHLLWVPGVSRSDLNSVGHWSCPLNLLQLCGVHHGAALLCCHLETGSYPTLAISVQSTGPWSRTFHLTNIWLIENPSVHLPGGPYPETPAAILWDLFWNPYCNIACNYEKLKTTEMPIKAGMDK